jgi:long-chain acyl-CoA synthetase
MARRTLLDFFDDLSALDGTFVVHDDGYRTWSFTYREIAAGARRFAERLKAAGIGRDHKVVLWSENRPEWLVVLWGCLLEGVVLVPIDYRSSPELMLRIADIVDAKAIVVGDVVPSFQTARPVWPAGTVIPSGELASVAGLEPPVGTGPDSTAEIIFTSGATADPKGVVLTHRNILANVVPIEREIGKYKRYARPFRPIRFLNLLPLSHMFGQSMATFIPPMLTGEVIFMRSFAPHDIIRQIHDRRISVLVSVPKMLEVLRDHVLRVAPEAATPPPPGTHWTKKWWIYRRIHRMFGFKFWAMVVGAAPLDPEVEAFWGRLGFLVVQGYGLTETAPVVTLNHPFHASRGAVGKPIAGVEVKIADDGEILVRGENVTRGYFNAPEETERAFSDGWFHTGDIGELDASGQLRIRGRKKEMIVTPEGLNVFPEDVERVLNAIPGVKESAVVGAPIGGSTAERVQAVLVVDTGANVDDIVRAANAQLLDHQKVRAAAVWPAAELPRTEGTRKLKRRELRNWLTASTAGAPAHAESGRSLESVVSRFAPGRTVTAATTIDELGLSSLERVELMLALEEAFQVTIDEARFAAAKTLEDLHPLVQPLEAGSAATVTAETAADVIDFPSWNRSAPAWFVRRLSLPTWILPASWPWMTLTVRGLEHLKPLEGPVVFAANHQSHLDTPAILRALPARWRYRIAPAMAKEFFKAHFFPDQYGRKAVLTNRLNYYLSSLFFNAFPLPQRETGTRQTLRYVGALLADGYSVLIFPEGKRTDRGEINEFRPGVGMIASRLNVPVVPVRLDGLHEILHQRWKFPRRGRGTVTFGAPMSLTGNDYKALAQRIEEAVRGIGDPKRL